MMMLTEIATALEGMERTSRSGIPSSIGELNSEFSLQVFQMQVAPSINYSYAGIIRGAGTLAGGDVGSLALVVADLLAQEPDLVWREVRHAVHHTNRRRRELPVNGVA